MACQTAAACAYERDQCRASPASGCDLGELNRRTDALGSNEAKAEDQRRQAQREELTRERKALRGRSQDVEKACAASLERCQAIREELAQEYASCDDVHSERCVTIRLWLDDASAKLRRHQAEATRDKNEAEAAERYRQRQQNLDAAQKP